MIGPKEAAVDEPGEADLLRQYLAGRDAACPSCGYNLRGAVGDRCPECARPLVLGIVRHGPAAALTWFLLLAFGWVFVAGAMNSVRNAQSIQTYVDNAQTWGITFQQRTAVRSGGTQVLAVPTAPARTQTGAGFWPTAWQVVPAMTWASAAWAFTLALGCGIGLLLMARRHRRPFGAAADQRMVRMACTLFAVYGTWHVVMFILEFS
jgi:hypothetical protein